MSGFTEEELEILDSVLNRFKNATSNDISEVSHMEDAWIKYNGTNKLIDYSEAFSLRALP